LNKIEEFKHVQSENSRLNCNIKDLRDQILSLESELNNENSSVDMKFKE